MTTLSNDELDDLYNALMTVADVSLHDKLDALFNMALMTVLQNAAQESTELAARQKAADDSWNINPDRMGGQFTEEEMSRGWGSEGW